jgi:hypothetical protein
LLIEKRKSGGKVAYEVIDDFLSKEAHQAIHDVLLGFNFPWYYNDRVNTKPVEGSNLDLQFSHNFYRERRPFSDYFSLLQPLWDRLEPRALLRVKANLNPITPEPYVGGWHRDLPFECMTAVYYVNTNNGYTEFQETGERVESVANRLVRFDSDMIHSGVTSTDTKARVLLNINYL